MKKAELTPTAQKIDNIINRIDEGDIKIPAFQRGYVWKQEQIIDLLESIVAKYPIGSVLLWKTSEKLKSTRNVAGYKIPERDESYPVNYTLDGQQRLASIYGVFSHQLEQEEALSGYNPDKDIFEIYYDFKKKQFLDKNSIEDPGNCVYLRNLLDVSTLIPALSELDPQYYEPAQDLASQFLNYEIPVVTIENRSRSDVGIIFERINNTGTRLTALDLMTAWTWTDDFHLLESCNRLSEELKEKGFGGIKDKTILQIVLRSTRFSKSNPITRAFLLLMAQMTPLDLIDAKKIDIDKSLSRYNRKEYHHVFPQAFLMKSRGVSDEKTSCVLNFCF
uniref:GmrSD restriction endonucleases N-terminal domain-containing protein n=1 Tax=Candidatus Kentrum sp. LFY TaxID=2126342 RepID=A0A450U5W2_9GAMM|nr:MAG: Protein of unknown function DUF262 [Candidatus Kentron sp. LFY]